MKGLMKLLILSLFLFPLIGLSQTTYIPLGSEEYILWDRMEIKLGKDTILNFSKTKPFSREYIVPVVKTFYNTASFKYGVGEIPPTNDSLQYDLDTKASRFSRVDIYNMRRAIINNIEWAGTDSFFRSKKPWGKTFYQTPGTLFEVHVKDFDLAINPVLYFQGSKEKDNDETLFLNTRGVRVRGRIANKIGFDSYISDNQERDPFMSRNGSTNIKPYPVRDITNHLKQPGMIILMQPGILRLA
jgi:hypothetical protein